LKFLSFIILLMQQMAESFALNSSSDAMFPCSR
jgi:Na+/serine symporter